MSSGWQDLLTILGALIVVVDFFLKFLAIGVLPHNKKPSAAMAWLIVIILIPIPGFILFLMLGRTNIGKERQARQRESDETIRTATDNLPTTHVEGPSYLSSMAKLNQNLVGSRCQDGNHIELIPGYVDAIDAMTREVEAATTSVEVMFYIAAWDEVTSAFFDALVAATARGVKVTAAVRPPRLARHPRLQGVRRRSSTRPRSSGSRCCPCGRSRASSSAPTCATTARSWSSTAGSRSRARRTSSNPATTSPRTTRLAASGSSWSRASTDRPCSR